MEKSFYLTTLAQIQAGEEPHTFSAYIRDILVDTTQNSIAANQVPELTVRAVVTKVWTLPYALTLASHVADAQRRAGLYAALLMVVSSDDPQRESIELAAIEAIEQIEYGSSRLSAFQRLIPHLSDQRQQTLLPQMLELALRVDTTDSMFGSKAVWALASFLPKELAASAAETITSISDSETQAWAWAALARQLDGERKEQTLRRGLEAALAISKEVHHANPLFSTSKELYQANALAQLGDQLTGELLSQALSAALAFENEQWRPRVIGSLASQLNETQKAITLDAVMTIQHPWYRAHALVGLMPYLDGDMLLRGLEVALKIEADEAKALIIRSVTFPEVYISRAIDMAFGIETEFYRLEAQVAIFAHLSAEQQHQILEDAVRMHDLGSNYHSFPSMMVHLAEQLDEAEAQRILIKALESLEQVPYEEERGYAFGDLADYLPPALLPRALEIALAFEVEPGRTYVLGTIAKHLPSDLVSYALAKLTVVHDYAERAAALTYLSQYIEGDKRAIVLKEAWQAAKAVEPLWERTDPLIRLLSQFEGEARSERVAYTLEIVRTLPNPMDKIKKLAALVPYLEQPERASVLDQAHQIALDIPDAYERTEALTALVKQADPATQAQLLTLAWETALKVGNPTTYPMLDLRATSMALVGQQATGDFLTRILITLQKEHPSGWQVLMVLDHPFTAQQRAIALEMINAIQSEGWRAQGLTLLAGHCDDPIEKAALLMQAVSLAKSETQPFPKIESLIALAKHFAGTPQQAELVQLAVETTAPLREMERAVALTKLFPFIIDRSPFIRQIREITLVSLEALRDQPRAAILSDIAGIDFDIPIFSTSILTAVTQQIIEIGR